MIKCKTIKLILLVTCLLMITAVNAYAVVVTFQQGDGGLFSETDGTFIDRYYQTPPRGDYTNLFSITRPYWQAKSLLRFPEIFGGSPGQIPYGSVINSAELTLMLTGYVSNSPYSFYTVYTDWDEDTVIWNTFGSVPGGAAGVDWDPNALYSLTMNWGMLQAEIPVTSSLQRWSDGEDNYGWMLQDMLYNGSSWHSDDSLTLSYRPLLTVDFTPAAVPEPGSIFFLGAGLLCFLGFKKRLV